MQVQTETKNSGEEERVPPLKIKLNQNDATTTVEPLEEKEELEVGINEKVDIIEEKTEETRISASEADGLCSADEVNSEMAASVTVLSDNEKTEQAVI